MSERRHLVLTGMMGAGKSVVGRECARVLDRPFVDTDALVEEQAGKPVPAIFAEDGEEAFRAHERSVIAEVAAREEPSVLAVGGGAVLDPDNASALREAGLVAWLTATSSTLAQRVGPDHDRPLLEGGDRAERLEALLRERTPVYAEVADVTVETEGRTVGEVVAEVVTALESAVERERA